MRENRGKDWTHDNDRDNDYHKRGFTQTCGTDEKGLISFTLSGRHLT